MDEKQKPRDMRDEAYAPLDTKTDLNDKLAGSPSAPAPKTTPKPAPASPGKAT